MTNYNYDTPLFKKLERLFASAREEVFEDGMDSFFSRDLQSQLSLYGDVALEMIWHLIWKRPNPLSPTVIGETLRWVGRMEEKYLHQRALLEKCLEHESHYVRDGAILGLASLDDPKAIGALRRAQEREPSGLLGESIEQVIEQLRQTLGWPPGYFDEVIGSLADEPMDEVRRPLMITISDYQDKAATTAVYPKERGVEYTTLGLVGEAGEIANKVKKVMRGDYDRDALREMLAGEIGDVLWYLAMLAEELGIDLGDIAQANLDKLASRKDRGVITGSGDDR